jgi:NitT/TauT family transport system substrate-binding protein
MKVWMKLSVSVRVALVAAFALASLSAGAADGSGVADERSIADASGAAKSGGAPDASGSKPEKVRLLLNWFPEMEHGGFYAALVNGDYAANGLDVEIQPGGVDVQVTPMVASGQVEFGVANADQVIFARAAGADVVALLAPLQKSPRCVMVHADQGIKGFEDLNDMTLAISPKDAFAEFLKQHFPLRNVKIVPYPGSVAPFLNDKRFGQQAYNISEPFLARQAGGNPEVLMLADVGYNPYASCLIVSDELLATKPKLVQRMIEASRHGWEEYLRDPGKTNERIHSLNPEMGLDILDFGVKELQGMTWLNPGKKEGIGDMSLDRWKALVATMEDLKLVPKDSVRAEACFR